MTRAVVIGGGIGGLCAAYTLQASGVATTLVERREDVGGKARNLSVGGAAIPGGPTVLTLREVFDKLFAVAGERLDDHVALTELDVLAHHRWSEGESLDLFRDVEMSAAAIRDFAGAAEADGYRRFVADAARVYATVEAPFIRSPKPDLFALAKATGPFGAYKIKPFDTMWSVLCRHFRDGRLQQLFGRYATYVGSSPFAAPATLMLVAHVEQRGVWAVDGGVAAIARAIADGFTRRGGRLLTGTEAREIDVRDGRVAAVATDGLVLPADAVIVNADVAALAEGHLGPRVRILAAEVPPKARTLSAVTFAGVARANRPLAHHTVAFGSDTRAEFEALFARRQMPDDPTVYICAPDGAAADEPQRVLLVMNAPANGDTESYREEDVARCHQQAAATLARSGLTLTFEAMQATTPRDFSEMLPATGGALYGRASHGWTASFQRAAIRTRVKGLYLAGGSVHPGPGVPMASLSGRIAAACLITDFGLANPSRRAATSGGISTA